MKIRVVLIAHGSRDPRWREPFEGLASRLGRDLGEDRIRLAFMEFAEPTLAQVADAAVGEGVERLVVLPLFMAGGGHVDHDIAAMAQAVRVRHPGLAVTVRGAVGEEERVVAAIEAVARELLA